METVHRYLSITPFHHASPVPRHHAAMQLDGVLHHDYPRVQRTRLLLSVTCITISSTRGRGVAHTVSVLETAPERSQADVTARK